MKINLSKHIVISRTPQELQGDSGLRYTSLKEIPLGYVNFDNVEMQPHIDVKEEFLQDKREKVTPYSVFSKANVFLFDSNNNVVQKNMKRQGDSYYYEPTSFVEFSPLSFNVYLEIQRTEQYYNNRIYDIKVGAASSSASLTFSNKLMRLFGDSYLQGSCPFNLRFNGGSTNYMTLIDSANSDCDFLFIKSADGVHYGTSDEEIDIADIFDNHTNVWLFCDDYKGRFKNVTSFDTSDITLNMTTTTLYTTESYRITRNQASVFNQDITFFDDTFFDDHIYLNEATLVLHKRNKGFVIVTPSWFLDNIDDIAQSVYETLIYCYLQRYEKSRTIPLWITDVPVNYLAYSTASFNRTHPKISLSDFLPQEDLSLSSLSIVDIIVDTPYVRYQSIDRNNYEISFVKVSNSTVPDPAQDVNDISFYTSKHTVIFYKPEDIFTVETPLSYSFTKSDNVFYLMVKPMISSSYDICTVTDQIFKIEDLTMSYSLFVGQGTSSLFNTFYLLSEKETPLSSYVKVADIYFTVQQDITIYDTRINGGGLPDDQPDDYNMSDIGNILGRPYRLGSSLVIRLPVLLKQYEERIRKELDKHVAAGDTYVIVFESKK